MTRLLALASYLTGALATNHIAMGSGSNGNSQVSTQNVNVGGATVQVTVGVTVIGWNAGGNNKWVNVNAPSRAQTGMVHKVVVGGEAGLVYKPSTVSAAIGDMVEFTFMSQNHSVTQSTFAKPCVKMAADALDSNLMPNPNNTISPAPVFKMQVTTMEPLWFYCKQRTGNHCGKGMVFSVNPSAAKSHDAFLQAAKVQNGTVTAPPPAAPPAAVAAPPASPPAAVAPAPSGVIAGQAGVGAGGACSCSCLCGVSSFPANAGIGMFGGMSGSLPMP